MGSNTVQSAAGERRPTARRQRRRRSPTGHSVGQSSETVLLPCIASRTARNERPQGPPSEPHPSQRTDRLSLELGQSWRAPANDGQQQRLKEEACWDAPWQRASWPRGAVWPHISGLFLVQAAWFCTLLPKLAPYQTFFPVLHQVLRCCVSAWKEFALVAAAGSPDRLPLLPSCLHGLHCLCRGPSTAEDGLHV